MRKIYLAAILVGSLLLASCAEDYESTISDKEKGNIPDNVQLLEYSDKSITVAWDFIKRATSYTVQLLESPDSDYPVYYYTTGNEDYYEFGKLEAYGSYYARVRANFTFSAVSDWVYIMNGDQIARIMPALGVVDQDYVLEQIKLINSSTSTLTFTWGFPYYKYADSNYDNDYEIALYEDEACRNLAVSWNLSNNSSTKIFTALTETAPRPLRFTFSGLEAGKAYYFKVKDLTQGEESYVYTCNTKPSLPAAVGSPAQKGDVVLCEDFGKFIHGGDILYTAAGYTRTNRSQWEKASGENPVDTSVGQAVCNQTAEFNVFDGGTVAVAYTEGAGMKGWGKSGNTSTRPGYIKIGGGSAVGILYTPELNSLPSDKNTVTVRFKAAVYKEGSNSFCEDIVVQSVEGVTLKANGAINAAGSASSEELVSIADAQGDFKDYKIVLRDVTPNSRIAIGSNKAKATANKTRFLLDEIVIELGDN